MKIVIPAGSGQVGTVLARAFQRDGHEVVVISRHAPERIKGGLRYLDPVSGQAGYFGIVEENGNQGVATLRLRVEDRKIAEAEWVIARKDAFGPNGPGGALVNPESLIANPPPERTVPREARASREAMLAIANSYDNNRIRTIYAAMYYPPPEMPVPNWPPYDGNWPLPATFAPAAAPAPAP